MEHLIATGMIDKCQHIWQASQCFQHISFTQSSNCFLRRKKKIQVLYSKLRPRGWYSYIPIFLAFYICKIYLYISFKTMWKCKSLASFNGLFRNEYKAYVVLTHQRWCSRYKQHWIKKILEITYNCISRKNVS